MTHSDEAQLDREFWREHNVFLAEQEEADAEALREEALEDARARRKGWVKVESDDALEEGIAEEELENSHAGFKTFGEARDFVFGGKCTFTVSSESTGKHFTFKVTHAKDGALSFVNVLAGSDNEGDFIFIGVIRDNSKDRIFAGKKGNANAPSFKALDWVLQRLQSGMKADPLPKGLRIQHEGRCSMCNKKLTDPTSVERGIGPDCFSRSGG
jgi:hypothetical protein